MYSLVDINEHSTASRRVLISIQSIEYGDYLCERTHNRTRKKKSLPNSHRKYHHSWIWIDSMKSLNFAGSCVIVYDFGANLNSKMYQHNSFETLQFLTLLASSTANHHFHECNRTQFASTDKGVFAYFNIIIFNFYIFSYFSLTRQFKMLLW